MSSRRMVTGILTQGTDETIKYEFDFQKFVAVYGAPSGAGACTLYDNTDNVDVSATKLTSDAVLSGNIVISKFVTGLVEDHEYQLNAAASFAGGYTFSGYVIIRAER